MQRPGRVSSAACPVPKVPLGVPAFGCTPWLPYQARPQGAQGTAFILQKDFFFFLSGKESFTNPCKYFATDCLLKGIFPLAASQTNFFALKSSWSGVSLSPSPRGLGLPIWVVASIPS